MMDFLNWVSEHWLLVVTLALIVSGTITVPKLAAAFFTALAADRMSR